MGWTHRIVGLALMIAVVGAGCGHDSAKPTSAPGASGSSDHAAPTISSAPPTTLSPEEARLHGLLLTPAELGVTFTDAQLDAPRDTTQPCGQRDPRAVIKPQARVVVLLADYLEGLGVAENLSEFSTVDEAQRVIALVRDGVSCEHGSITNANSAAPITLSAIQDVSAQVGGSDTFAVIVTLADSSQITTIVARVDRFVVQFQIGSKSQSGALDPLQTAKHGVDKITAG